MPSKNKQNCPELGISLDLSPVKLSSNQILHVKKKKKKHLIVRSMRYDFFLLRLSGHYTDSNQGKSKCTFLTTLQCTIW